MNEQQLQASVNEIRLQVERLTQCQPLRYLLDAKDALRRIILECSKLEQAGKDDE